MTTQSLGDGDLHVTASGYWCCLPLPKPCFFGSPGVWVIDLWIPWGFTQGFEVKFLVKKSRKNVKNLSGSGRRSDAPNASDFCEWCRILAEQNYQGLLFCVFACYVLLSIHQQAFPDWKRGRSHGLQVMTKNLKCSSAPATLASKGSGRDVIILVCKIWKT